MWVVKKEIVHHAGQFILARISTWYSRLRTYTQCYKTHSSTARHTHALDRCSIHQIAISVRARGAANIQALYSGGGIPSSQMPDLVLIAGQKSRFFGRQHHSQTAVTPADQITNVVI